MNSPDTSGKSPEDHSAARIDIRVVATLTPENIADAELVEAFRGGEVAAFEELYRRHHTALMRRLTRICRNEAIAEELAQETFLRASSKIASDGALYFKAWLLRIGTNLCIDYLRERQRLPVTTGAIPVEQIQAPSGAVIDTAEVAERNETARQLWAVLDRLSPRHRTALVLREIEGLDYRTLAARLGISTSAVETLLFRARGRLRTELLRDAARREGSPLPRPRRTRRVPTAASAPG